MTTITLNAIKEQQTKIAEMIAAFESTAAEYHFPETTIDLAPGEHYAGIIIGKDGEESRHLILMAAIPTDDLNWKAANDWAKRIGGSLPTRREQSLLFANLAEQFEERAYWSCQLYEPDSGYAWCQGFYNGYQYSGTLSAGLRARAVRRLPV